MNFELGWKYCSSFQWTAICASLTSVSCSFSFITRASAMAWTSWISQIESLKVAQPVGVGRNEQGRVATAATRQSETDHPTPRGPSLRKPVRLLTDNAWSRLSDLLP